MIIDSKRLILEAGGVWEGAQGHVFRKHYGLDLLGCRWQWPSAALESDESPSAAMPAGVQLEKISYLRDPRWTNVLQERLFLSEDAPSQSRFGAQDLLQSKASWLLHATGSALDDSLPPGFETPHAAYQSKKEISQIALIKWQCPPRIILNPEWLVVAGEESEEVAVENQRQLGVLEAIYPHPSLTPQTPFDSSEARNSHHDDLQTPLIPITAVEDEEESDMLPTTSTSEQLQQPSGSVPDMGKPQILSDLRFAVEQAQCNLIPDSPCVEKTAVGAELGAEPDIVAAASAAFTAIMRSNEEGSLIDRDLLIKILNNPTLIEKLVSEYGASKQTQSSSASVSAPVPPPPPQFNLSISLSAAATTHTSPRPNVVAPASVVWQTSLAPAVQIDSKPLASASLGKDMRYYKSLIQQHGEERQDALDLKKIQFPNHYNYRNVEGANNVEATRHNVEAAGYGLKQSDMKPKVPKSCMYFNSPRGCWHGANCLYQHDTEVSQRVDRRKGAKRIKLDREILGRN